MGSLRGERALQAEEAIVMDHWGKNRSDAWSPLWTHTLPIWFCFAIPRITVLEGQTAEMGCLKEEHS